VKRYDLSILGSYSSFNFGDYIMLISFLEILDSLNCPLKVLVYSSTKHYLLKLLEKEFSSSKISVEIEDSLIRFIFKSLFFSKVQIIGGGTLLIKKRAVYRHALFIAVLRLLGKRVFLLSVDGDLSTSFWARMMVRLSNYSVMRVHHVYEQARKIADNVYLLPDVSVVYFTKRFKRKDSKGKGCCVVIPIYIRDMKNADVKKGCVEAYQDLQGINRKLPYRFPKEYFQYIMKFKKVYTYHYHTLMFCRLMGIDAVSLQPHTKKHQSVAMFSLKEYRNAVKVWKNIISSVVKTCCSKPY